MPRPPLFPIQPPVWAVYLNFISYPDDIQA